MRWSIRWRLTLWNTLALAVALLGFAALVYGLLTHALYEQVDRTLRAGLRELERDPHLASGGDDRLRYWMEELKEHENLLAVAYGPGGTVRARTAELAADGVPPPPAVPGGGYLFQDVTLPALGRQRSLAGRVRAGGRELTVVLLAPLTEVDHELGELLGALGLAVPAAVAAAGGLGYLLARKALAPVDELRELTQGVTADRLDRRVPVANSHDELGRLAATINAMIGRLEHSFAEVRRFTADASHELRTPLSVLRTEVEVALGKPLGPEEVQQLLGSVLEECERLTRLTDQLLALARQDAGPAVRREPIRLAELLGEVVETVRPLAEVKGLALRFVPDGPPRGGRARGDAGALRQVFLNLLDNAIKYTPDGGAVAVEVAHRDRAVEVRVRDTGEGIPAEHLPHVFDRFYRVDKARSRAAGGSGLGLSIARGIVAAHGGSIELTSTPGRGTTFTVTLPAEPGA